MRRFKLGEQFIPNVGVDSDEYYTKRIQYVYLVFRNFQKTDI